MAMGIWEFTLNFIRKRMWYIHNSTFTGGVFGSHGDWPVAVNQPPLSSKGEWLVAMVTFELTINSVSQCT